MKPSDEMDLIELKAAQRTSNIARSKPRMFGICSLHSNSAARSISSPRSAHPLKKVLAISSVAAQNQTAQQQVNLASEELCKPLHHACDFMRQLATCSSGLRFVATRRRILRHVICRWRHVINRWRHVIHRMRRVSKICDSLRRVH